MWGVKAPGGGSSFPDYTQSTAPASPTSGEFWWDTTVNVLKRYNGTSWDWVGLDDLANVDTSGKANGDALTWDTDGDPDAWVAAAGGGGGTLQWTSWTPVVKNGTTTPTQTVDSAYYLKVGPLTMFWFVISITGAGGAGEINITGQPTALQDAHHGANRHIGSVEFQDSGNRHTTERLFAHMAAYWRMFEYNQFGAETRALANGDKLKGYGFVHNSDAAVAI